MRPADFGVASAYGAGSRALHRLVLGNPLLGELLLDIDAHFARVDLEPVRANRHVFIAGLPRSGSSVLLRRLHATGAFVSMSYRDMPFVLAPALWRRIRELAPQSRVPEAGSRERAHGDGLAHDFDTPEAFEEVFWGTIDGASYRRRDRLIPHAPEAAVSNAFLRFLGATLASRDTPNGRYLSKNNGNILRLTSLRSLLPASVLIIPFRDPLQQAHSLWRQHLRAVSAAAADSFVGQYMGWLGHHAFGPARRAYDLGGSENPYAPDEFEHWLWLWNEVYRWLAASAPSDALFVNYELLCRDSGVWQRIATITRLSDQRSRVPLTAAPETDVDAPAHLEASSRAIFADLLDRHRSGLSEPI